MAMKNYLSHDNDNKNVIYEGYLLKESKYMKYIRKRWVSLTKMSGTFKLLSYQITQLNTVSPNPTEIFDLNIYDTVNYDRNIENKSFELISSKHKTKRKFIAETHNEMLKWVQNIQHKAKAWKIVFSQCMHDVGVTALIKIFVDDPYWQKIHNQWINFANKQISINGLMCTFRIWYLEHSHAHGHSCRASMPPLHFYQFSECIIFMFDVDRPFTFDEIEQYSCINSIDNKETLFVLVANRYRKYDYFQLGCKQADYRYRKYDFNLECVLIYSLYQNSGLVIPTDIIMLCRKYLGALTIAQPYADKNNMLFYEISSKTGHNVNEMFMDIASKLYSREFP
eukprot:224386_1